METETLTQPDAASELAAGRPYPMRNALEPMGHTAAVRLLQDRRAWWLDVADYYVRMAGEAADRETVQEYLYDAREALAESRKYAPKAGA